MAKRRMINPETWTDEKFVQLDPLARLLFIGMWNFACDNGHLDDSPLQLKMRVLPADNCDPAALLDQLIDVGVVTRGEGWVKVTNLSEKQPLDLRFLVFCDHCAHDEDTTYSEADRKETRRAPRGGTTSARRAHDEDTAGARRRGGGAVDGGGDGGGGRNRPTRIPDIFAITDDMRAWARENELHHLDLDAVTAEFIDHWRGKSGKEATKVDWIATWRNWVRREKKFMTQRGVKPVRPHIPGVPEGWIQ